MKTSKERLKNEHYLMWKREAEGDLLSSNVQKGPQVGRLLACSELYPEAKIRGAECSQSAADKCWAGQLGDLVPVLSLPLQVICVTLDMSLSFLGFTLDGLFYFLHFS